MMTLFEKRDGTFVSVTHSTSSDFDLIAVELRYVLRFMRDYGLTYSSSRKLFSRMLATTAISETLFDHVHVLLTGDERPAAAESDHPLENREAKRLLGHALSSPEVIARIIEFCNIVVTGRTDGQTLLTFEARREIDATEAQRKRKVRKPRTV